ncbi:MAG: M28 family peptidase [Planctomycetes bacterium]|nr:M28 family peptidase [Planctomycetota bacterium]
MSAPSGARRKSALAAWALALGLVGCRVEAAQDPPRPSGATRQQQPASENAPDPQELAAARAPSGRRALRWIEDFCALGPRVPGTEGAEKARAAIVAAIRAAGGEPKLVPLRMATSRGEVEFVNLLAELPGKSSKRIVWGAHYDTPDVSEDPYWQSEFPPSAVFVGANDGGSGVAVLLELLRALRERGVGEVGHSFLFLDGEERIGPPPFNPTLDDPKANACFGARGQVARWREAKRLPEAFVLLDMVGDRELGLVRETSYSDARLLELFQRAAASAGLAETQLVGERGMMDDHVPFQAAGVPSIDLIDWSYGPPDARGRAGAYWHTPADTPDKLSAQSLETSAKLCLAAVPELERFARGER